MFEYYFTYWDGLPKGIGNPMFGAVHIAWLVGIATAVVLCTLIFLRLEDAGQHRFLLTLAFLMLALEAYREIVLAATGYWDFSVLPLHLCGLAIFLEALFVFFPRPFFGEMVCAVCLPGAASALLFPDWLRYPTVNYMNLHGFILHGILCLLPVLLLASGRYRPKIKRVWMPLAFLAASALIVHRINVAMRVNFMFLNRPSEGSPFEAVYRSYGYAAYLVVYIAVVIGIILLMYAGIYLTRGVRKREGRAPGDD